jgi:hypothetical protein
LKVAVEPIRCDRQAVPTISRHLKDTTPTGDEPGGPHQSRDSLLADGDAMAAQRSA